MTCERCMDEGQVYIVRTGAVHPDVLAQSREHSSVQENDYIRQGCVFVMRCPECQPLRAGQMEVRF
jgi:hypothetical protein